MQGRPSEAGVGGLGRGERRVVRALARALCPKGERLPEPDEAFLDRLGAFLDGAPRLARAGYRVLFWLYELGALLRFGRRASSLPPEKHARYLAAWHALPVAPLRFAMYGVFTTLKLCWYADHQVAALIGYRPPHTPPLAPVSQALSTPGLLPPRPATPSPEGPVRAEVVVIGTGAGGAVVASELAALGRDVAILEEGLWYDRRHFNRRPFEMARLLYRDLGMTLTVGNVPIPVPLGRAVGGTTTINSGTCFRAPPAVLGHWVEEGLELSPERLAPYYQRVENFLGVTEVPEELLGRNARLVRKGAAALGLTARPLRRNAPACKASAVCCFGCPTDAKRSTNVSYVPRAIEAGARLYTGVRVTRVLVEGRRAVGVRGVAESGREVTFRADAVVVACGAFHTPLLLRASGLRAPELGRNLTIHPASKVAALMEDEVVGWEGVPQGMYIDDLAHEGVVFEGAFLPPDYASTGMHFHGAELTRAMENLTRTAAFGFMIEDTGRGRVRRGPGGRPLAFYSLGEEDVRRLKRGVEVLARLFFAAGAKEVYPPVLGFGRLLGEADLARFLQARIPPSAFDLAAFHPLGTARMASSPAHGVVDGGFESFEVERLFVTDGSALPSALGVNPQLTIMALATLAAEQVNGRLSGAERWVRRAKRPR